MSKVVLEELVYKISADMEQFKKSMDEVNKASKETAEAGKSSFEKIGGSISDLKMVAGTLGAALGVKEIIEFGKASLDFANQIGETSDAIGITTQALQELRYAGNQNNVSFEEMDAALGKFSKTIGDAVAGNDEAKKTFEILGVTLRDTNGQLKSTDQILMDVSDGVSQFGSQAEKASLLTDLFGRAGGKLIPTLGSGSQAIREFGIEAGNAGAIIDEKTIKAAQNLDDWLAKIAVTAKAKTANALVGLYEWIKSNSGTITNAAGSFGIYGKALQIATSFVGQQEKAVQKLTKAEGDLIAYQQKRASEDSKSLEEAAKAQEAKKKLIEDSQKLIDANFKAESTGRSAAIQEEIAQLQAANAVKNELHGQYYLAIAEREKAFKEMKSQEAAKDIEELIAQNEMMAQIDAAKYESDIAENQKNIDAKKAQLIKGSTEQLKILAEDSKARIALRQKTAQSEVDVFSAAANLISSVAASGSKAAFLISKAAAIAQSIVSTNVASAMALATPPGPPFTIPLAANVKMAGMLNTAAIAATTVKGLQSGADMLPGPGVRDSIPTMLAPGERVVPRETNRVLEEFLQGIKNGQGMGAITINIGYKDGGIEHLIDIVEAKFTERNVLKTSSRSA